MPFGRPEGKREQLWAETRATHPEQQSMLEAGVPDIARNAFETLGVRELIVDDSKPAEPIRFIPAGPERRVSGPEATRFRTRLPIVDGVTDRGLYLGGEA